MLEVEERIIDVSKVIVEVHELVAYEVVDANDMLDHVMKDVGGWLSCSCRHRQVVPIR